MNGCDMIEVSLSAIQLRTAPWMFRQEGYTARLEGKLRVLPAQTVCMGLLANDTPRQTWHSQGHILAKAKTPSISP